MRKAFLVATQSMLVFAWRTLRGGGAKPDGSAFRRLLGPNMRVSSWEGGPLVSAFRRPLSRRRERRRLASPLRPSRQIPLRPRRERALAGEAALRPGQTFPRFVEARRGDRGKQAKIDVHRLERARAGADRFDVAAGDVIEKRADGGCQRRGLKLLSEPLSG